MRRSAALLLLAACAAPPEPSDADAVATVRAFRAALAAEDAERVRALLAPDPRRWFDEREGAGIPWDPLAGGAWSGWDEHFRGASERRTPWRVAGDAVTADLFETNDYFRLIERDGGGGWWRATYFLDESGRVAGFLVAPVPGRAPPADRGDEFRAWAFSRHPEEAAYLMPDGRIDPSGDRPARMRALLNAWREEVGLAPIR